MYFQSQERSSAHPPVAAVYDYEEIYPPDPLWQELGENSRVWHVYNDEAEVIDGNLVEEFGDHLDILLIFVSSTH